ncbi:excisionase [Pseudomonas chlororaphis subsp. piscium]|nr:excisionase [Pseudomonas chlororaphis subsp. piscium]
MSIPRWVMIKRAVELTGYSKDAIEHKVKNGTWAQGRVWRYAPDGRIAINMTEYDKWAESAPQEVA